MCTICQLFTADGSSICCEERSGKQVVAFLLCRSTPQSSVRIMLNIYVLWTSAAVFSSGKRVPTVGCVIHALHVRSEFMSREFKLRM